MVNFLIAATLYLTRRNLREEAFTVAGALGIYSPFCGGGRAAVVVGA